MYQIYLSFTANVFSKKVLTKGRNKKMWFGQLFFVLNNYQDMDAM